MTVIDELANNVVERYMAALANPVRADGQANPDINLRSLVYVALSTMAQDAYIRGGLATEDRLRNNKVV